MFTSVNTFAEKVFTTINSFTLSHTVEYAGYKKGDFRIDENIIIEVGGQDKDFSQIADQENAYVAADDIESAYMKKIPLWAFGFLY